jgi:transposase-like protein
MVREHGPEHPSQWAAITSIASKFGCTPETLRNWVRQAEGDSGQRGGCATSAPPGAHTALRPTETYVPVEAAWFAMTVSRPCHVDCARAVR